MKTHLSIKTLLRTPLKTLLTLLLLAATSYMLFFSVAEYAVTSRERERAVDFYEGTGAVEAEPLQQPTYTWYNTDLYLYADPRLTYNPYEFYEETLIKPIRYTGLSQADIDALAKLPHVTGTSTRYMTAGVSDDLMRADYRTDFYNYTARYIVEGTLESFRAASQPPAQYEANDRLCSFTDIKVLAGDPKWYSPSLHLKAMEFSSDNPDDYTTTLGTADRSISTIFMGASYYDEVYSHEFLNSLVPGERYIIIVRHETISGAQDILSDSSTIGWWYQVYPMKDLPENYLELEEFAPLREMIEITNADLHTFDVVYTDDMSSIMRFAQNNMVVTNGRMLTDEDSENNVCVMSEWYMSQNGLQIGDKISLKLGDKLFEQNAQLGAVAVVRERYADTFTEATEFEIVGAYRDVGTMANQAENLNWTYSVNTVFVPTSFLPVEVPDDHVVKPGEFSFTIDDPRNISAFLAETRPIIENELGLKLLFTDGGWSALEGQVNQAATLATIRLLLLFFSTVVAIILTVYLFIGRKRKEYAIMRALGTPKSLANRSLYIPLAVLAAFALAAGNILGYVFIGDRIADAVAPFAEAGLAAETAVPGYLLPVCFVCVFAALALVTAFMLYRIGKKPPLELLQAGINRNAAKMDVSAAAPVMAAPVPIIRDTNDKSLSRSKKRYSAARFVGSYVARHIWRTPVKSLFSLTLALLLVGTIGQLTVMRGVYRDMYDNIDVKAYVIDGFVLRHANEAVDLEYIDTVYYENTIRSIECYSEKLKLVMTNDVERFSGGAAEVEFLDGYDFTSLATVDTVSGPVNRICVMESGLMQALGVELGDTVRFHNPDIQYLLVADMFGPSDPATDPEWGRKAEAVDPELDEKSVFFTVVGEAVSGCDASSVFIPVTKGIARVFSSGDNILDYAEYTLASPKYAEEFSKFAKSKNIASVGDIGSPFVMDTSEADNMLRTIGLLDNLYPIAIAVAAIMGGLFPGLVVMQSDREASIMRVLGTTKKRTRVMLTLEQGILCVIGLTCAVFLLLAINGWLPEAVTRALGAYSGLHVVACVMGASICAVIITRRRILELLQVKE